MKAPKPVEHYGGRSRNGALACRQSPRLQRSHRRKGLPIFGLTVFSLLIAGTLMQSGCREEKWIPAQDLKPPTPPTPPTPSPWEQALGKL